MLAKETLGLSSGDTTSMVGCAYNPSTRKAETGESRGLAGQPSLAELQAR